MTSEKTGYPDCPHCKGWGYWRVVASDAYPEGSKLACGNCEERRRWEGLDREPQNAWCVWTKSGHRPVYWHDSREKAENEAARLARTMPNKTFIVFEKLVNIRVAATPCAQPPAPSQEQSK